MTTHTGSCHCGGVQFETEVEFTGAFRCNCSFCVRRGAIIKKVPAENFRVIKGEENLSSYGERDFATHFFCKKCGIQMFSRIIRAEESSVGVSLACLTDVDLDSIAPKLFDGANLL
jgi:hypothetical protein